jgi:hypothetical protein
MLQPEPAQKTAKVKVKAKYRVVHKGRPYTGGEELVIPQDVADQWLKARFVENVASKEKS